MGREIDPSGAFYRDTPDSYPVDDWSVVGSVGDFRNVGNLTMVKLPDGTWQELEPLVGHEDDGEELTPDQRRRLSDRKMELVRESWKASISKGTEESEAIHQALSYASAIGVEYLDSDGDEVSRAKAISEREGVRRDPVADILDLQSSEDDWELINRLEQVNSLVREVDDQARFVGLPDPWSVLRIDPDLARRLQLETAALLEQLSNVVDGIFSVFRKAAEDIMEQLEPIIQYHKAQGLDAINRRLGDLRSSLGSSQELRHGSKAICPQHGPTKGGLCRRCNR